MENKQKIIVILGQTATGKSDLAVKIAKQIKGEVISADSRQVYKGMDLGTGKITKGEMGGVKHHLLDIVSPKKIFSVNDFQKIAGQKINEIFEKNKIPIICGGTAFYIDTLINQTSIPSVPPNQKLRNELDKKEACVLLEILKKLDPDRARNIDPKNKIRLIRAIEISKTLGKVPVIPTSNVKIPRRWTSIKIGLTLPPEILKERIKNRLLIRIKKGMIREIKNLHEKEKISWKRLESFGLEYRYVARFLKNSKNLPPLLLRQAKEEMVEKLNTEIWHFAKRQKTWWKRDKDIIWIDPRKKSDKNKALKKIKEFLKK